MAYYGNDDMRKFRQMAQFLREFDWAHRSGSTEEAINIVIAMVNRDRPLVDSLTSLPKFDFQPLEGEEQSDSCPETGTVYGDLS